jgi:hypothetical protein
MRREADTSAESGDAAGESKSAQKKKAKALKSKK